jgi:OOP family OmpA-OmpF porin
MPGIEVSVATVAAEGANGALRTNAATGLPERLMGGFWLAVPQIDVGLQGCQTAADGVLAGETITFLSGSDELDASAVRVINMLGSIMARCAEEAALKAVIGGHTDSVGDATANLGLSQRRAIAVRRELIARGVPAAALKSVGYGAEQPVGENDTEEGRAKNRRTTIVWSE